jgi:tetratricopeptide (TPR) repeat protein
VPDVARLRGEIQALMGNAYMQLGRWENARTCHLRDLDLAVSDEARSRALGNVGRVFAATGQADKAIEHWLDKLPLCAENPVETAWLCHEIGRAYLELGKPYPALE